MKSKTVFLLGPFLMVSSSSDCFTTLCRDLPAVDDHSNLICVLLTLYN